VKNIVDDAIDQCAAVFNLRNSIEETRVKAEQAADYNEQKLHAQRGSSRQQHCTVSLKVMNEQVFRVSVDTLN
jgi:hypothetical protein